MDAGVVRAFLDRVRYRIAWRAAAEGAAGGLAIACIAQLAWLRTVNAFSLSVVVALAAAAAAIRMRVSRVSPSRAALLIERCAPASRNVVATAAELIDGTVHAHDAVRARVLRDAVRVATSLQAAAVVPLRRALIGCGAALTLWLVTAAATSLERGDPVSNLTGAAPEIDAVDITVTAPPYSGRAPSELHDPSRVEALAGSSMHVAVRLRGRTSAAAVSLTSATGREPMKADARGIFGGDLAADADGYLAVELTEHGPVSRKLIGLSVTPDQPPRVRVTAPGKDLVLASAQRTVDVAIEATDDLGLATLVLRYTKVSGSGEQFTFSEGEIPVAITRTDARTWTARGVIDLAGLKLVAGDMLVYRGVATDRRPGAPPSESDAFFIEIPSPGSVAAGGFALDDELDRYGLSQQMVIQKTMDLIAKRASLAADSVGRAALALAAEQRAVRAQFVFMMGGEVAEEILAAAGLDLNEEAEAANEEDLAAGRMQNQGQLALIRAIRAMSRANTSLTAVRLDTALKEERNALAQLQSAFARARYILRALTLRERLDLTRRLSGDLSAVFRTTRPAAEPAAERRTIDLRRMLAALGTLAADRELGEAEANEASRLAEGVLAIDPAAPSLQRVAQRLNDGASAINRRQLDAARALLDSATIALGNVMRAGAARSPGRARGIEAGMLAGALVDALRAAGLSR